MTMKTIAFKPHPEYGAARGRNGYFDPRKAYVYGNRNAEGSIATVRLEVDSRSPGKASPIVLSLPPDEATELAKAILEMAGTEKALKPEPDRKAIKE